MRDVQQFLSVAHLEAIAGLSGGFISILLCLREQGDLWGGRDLGGGLVHGAGSTHDAHQLSAVFDVGMVRDAPRTADHRPPITDPHNKCNNEDKVETS